MPLALSWKLSPIGMTALAWLTRTFMRLPLSLYSMCVASNVHGFSPGASAARAWTPGSAMAAAVNAANRGLMRLVTPTTASADARRRGAAFLRTVGATLLRRFVG